MFKEKLKAPFIWSYANPTEALKGYVSTNKDPRVKQIHILIDKKPSSIDDLKILNLLYR